MSGRAVIPWVVLPFVALSALALWATGGTLAPTGDESARPPVVAPLPPAPLPAPPADPVPAPTPARAAPPRVEPLPLPEDEPPLPELPPGTWHEEEVREALRAAQPLVRECFLDVAARYPGAQTVTVRTTLDPRGERGRFHGGEVMESTLQDPFVLACLLEALADTQFSAPAGREPLTLTLPLHFRPRKQGGP